MPDFFQFLPDREYRETFEVKRFEAEVEDSQSIIERAFDQYRAGVEVHQQARRVDEQRERLRRVEQEQQPPTAEQRAAAVAEFEREVPPAATAMEQFRQVEQDLQPGVVEFESAVPTAEELMAGMTAGAEGLRERVGGLGIERLAAEREETPYERRRSLGQVPAQARAGFPYEPETEAARERLTENLRQENPEWSEEQLHKAATAALDPGEGFMPMAAWGLAMRPAMALMAARGGAAQPELGAALKSLGRAAAPQPAPVVRASVATAEGVARLAPKVREAGRRLLTEERGGGALRPKMVLTNDIRTPMEITARLNQLAKLERLTKAQKAERIRLYAEKDLNELRTVGNVDDQMDALLADIKEMGQELELRAVSREYKPTQAPAFGTAERAEWEAARAGRPHGYRPETQFKGEPREVVEGRLKVYQEFADNMKIEAAKPGEEHLVTRAKFTERGQIIEEPTFATEGELAGVRPAQGELGIGAGERPIQTAGPMFQEEVAAFERAVPRARPAPKPTLEEAPAWELAGMGSADEMEGAVLRGLEGGRIAPAAPPGSTRAGAGPTAGRGGTPPPPRKPPVTAETAGGTPPEAASNVFVAPLREFDDVLAEVVTSENPVVRALVGKTGINPSVLNDTPVGRALTAYWRQSVSGELLSEVAISPALDVHAQMFTGRMGRVLKITPQGEITSIRSLKPGQSRMWQDVFSRPGDYTLPSELRTYIDDYLTVVRETEAMRVAAGLKPRAIRGEEGWFYVPRQVKEIRGVELRRPSNPGLQRIYEEAQEGVAAGVRYSDNPRATLEIHVRNAYREVAEKQLADALEPLGIATRELIPEGMTVGALKAGQQGRAVGKAIEAIQRAKRGEQLPTGTIKAIERVFPSIEGELSPATRITLEDLIRAGQEAAKPPVELPVPTGGTIKKLQRLLDEAREAALANPGNAGLQKQARKLASQLGFAKYRISLQEPFVLAKHPVKTLRGIQMKALDELLTKIRGTPYYAKTSTGTRVTRYRGGLMEPVKERVAQVRGQYSRAMASARASEVAPGNLFGQAEETIPIASWRNRFFPREQADLLNETLGSFLRPAQKINPFARGIEVAGNYSRFFKAVGDFAMPFIQGLPTLTYRPWVWARMTVRHYQAWLDPTVQARLMRQRIGTFQKMAQNYTPIGDPEFFAALQRGGGVSAGRLVEMLPKGAEVRGLLRHGGKQTFGRFQASYNTGLASNRALLYESLQPAWKGTEGELWQFIRNMTGGLDSRALGVGPSQRGFESVWMAFSPRLLRSTAALITDAARPGTPQGRAALQALGGLCSFAAGIYVLTGLSLGKSWEEIGEGLNPLKGKKFLSHEINGDWIGVGGQVRAITQFMAHSLSAVAPGGEPIESFIEKNQFENPILRFYSSRGAPAVNIVGGLVEFGTGLNVLPFEQVDSGPNLLKHTGRSVTPFALLGKLEGEQWGTTVAALAGARTSAATVYEERNKSRDEGAQQMFGRDWADLLRGEQNDVREANPTLRELETEATELGAERDYKPSQRTQAYRESKDELGDEGERALDSDPTGREWVSWRKTVGIELNTTWEQLTIRFGIEDEPREPEFIEDRLAERFWNLELDTNNDGLISGAEYSAHDAERETILGEARAAGVDEEYIRHGYRGQMWPNHPRLQAVEEEYQQAKEIAHEYHGIPYKDDRMMPAEQQDQVSEYVDQAIDIASMEGFSFRRALEMTSVPDELFDLAIRYKRLGINPARERYWRMNREDERTYKKFYRDIPIQYGREPEPEFALAGSR